MAAKPLVYLIGAGPGDPGLLTLKGNDCLARADIIIYDYLANPQLLASARPDAEIIYVGKKGFSEHVSQAQINDLLVEAAERDGGKTVARLKGGDPFIFGRGGEEALVLHEHGIAFEIVPGISAGYAAPAYAGIPVTHRGLTTDMAFVTGHEDPSKAESEIDWTKLATAVGTICFFMGIKNLPLITTRLQENGRSAETPVALIRWGTTPRQEVLTGTLADIAEKAAAVNFQAPAITVVGEVVGLREELQWFENRPLFGQTIVVTRSRTQASVLTSKLADAGANVLEFPTIRISEPFSWDAADAAISEIATYDWLIFTSANGVDAFFSRLRVAGRDTRALGRARVAAIGPATAARLQRHGVSADFTPSEYRAEAIVAGLAEIGVSVGSGTHILIPRAQEAREILPEALTAMGAEVDVVPVYATVPAATQPGIIENLSNGEVNIVTFTSSSTVRNFVQLLDAVLPAGQPPAEMLRQAGVKVASIGPITSATARQLGLNVDVEAREYTIAGLVEAIREMQNQEN